MADSGVLVFRDRAGLEQGRVTFYAAGADGMGDAAVEAVLQLDAASAQAEGEAALQLLEGLRYEYECSAPAWQLALQASDAGGIVRPSRLAGRKHSGMLVPGLATGLMPLVLEDASSNAVAWAQLEIRSRKLDYKADYRQMMEDISARCIDLLGDWKSASQFKAEPDAGTDAQTAGQRFAFVRGLLDAESFRTALHRITSHPHQRWEQEANEQPIGRGFRPDRSTLSQLARGKRRGALPASHPLHARLGSVPERITVMRASLTEDTPENRFVKFALQGFQHFVASVAHKVSGETEPRLAAEVAAMATRLEMALNSDVLRHVGQPDALPLGSPVMQRREGYREVLQAWLKFALAAKLVWQGGEDVYGAGQRDVAALYEYWVFFCLLDLVADLFALDKPAGSSLLEETGDGFGLKLKAGKFLALSGRTRMHHRELSVQLGYNRSFQRSDERRKASSWSQAMRPDYTLSFWPAGFTADEAEAQELMVHVHFDAKYRVENLRAILGDSADEKEVALSKEKAQQSSGTYKRADLLKMHAYRDAIRRTHGAYVLYPGTLNQQREGFHEVLPGLGAFALRPGGGSEALREFLVKVVAHVCDRASAREQLSFAAYRNYRVEEPLPLYQAFPERTGTERHTPPRQSFVLAGWCKDAAHLAWIRASGLYNFRMGSNRGSLALSPDVAGASYLLLHDENGQALPGLLQISDPAQGPKVYSREALIAAGYSAAPSQDFYLVFAVGPAPEFEAFEWDYTALASRPAGAETGEPFAVSLHELMQVARLSER